MFLLLSLVFVNIYVKQVSLEKQVSHDTILNYVTTGVLLQKLIGVKNLNEYTHIIVDEIHERDQEMDFLILLLRKFLYMNSFHIRVNNKLIKNALILLLFF